MRKRDGIVVVLGGMVATAALTLLTLKQTRGAVGIGCGLLLLLPIVRMERSRAVVYAVLLPITLEVLVPITRIQAYGSLKIAVPALAATATILGLIRLRSVRPTSVAILWLVMFVLMAPETLSNSDVNASKVYWSAFIVTVPLVLLASSVTPAQRFQIQKAIFFLGLGEAVLDLCEQVFSLKPIWKPAFDFVDGTSAAGTNNLLSNGSTRSQGTLGHPLLLGLVLVVAFAILLTAPVVRRRFWRLICAATLIAAMIYAGDRSAILFAVAAILLFAGYRYRSTFMRVTFGMVPLLLFGIIAGYAGLFGSKVVTTLTSSTSVTHRSASIADFGALFHQPFLQLVVGNGFYSSPRLYSTGILPPTNDGGTAIDNQWISTFAQQGLIGLFLLCLIFLVAIGRADRSTRAQLLICAATLFIFDALLWPSSVVLLGLITALAVVQPEPSDDLPTSSQVPQTKEFVPIRS